MPRSTRETRTRILTTAYKLFHRNGFARVGVDTVAEQAGITKRTLYYHFESKDQLLAAVLDFQHMVALSQVQDALRRVRGDDANALVQSLFSEFAAWASQPRWTGTGFTRLVMELADRPGHPARAIASWHKAAVEGWLAQELEKRKVKSPEARAREVVLLLEGTNALILIHRDPRYAKAAAEAAARLVRH